MTTELVRESIGFWGRQRADADADTGPRSPKAGLEHRLRPPDTAEAPDVTYEIIETLDDLVELVPAWDALYQRSYTAADTFHHPRRILHWAQIKTRSGRPPRLAIATAREHGRLIAVAPFLIERLFGARALTWAGTPFVQYGDVLIAPDQNREAIGDRLVEFATRATKVDIVRLRSVRRDANCASILARAGAKITASDNAPLLDLSRAPTAADYETRHSSKQRRNRRRLLRRLQETADITFNVCEPGPHAARVVRAALSMKRGWLVDRGEASYTLADHDIDEWLAAMADDPESGLYVSEMRSDGILASVQIGLRDDDRLSLYLIVFSLKFERDGVGALHLEQTIRDCFDAGISTLDLLGPDTAFKRKWCDKAEGQDDFVLPVTLTGRIVAAPLRSGGREFAKAAYSRLPERARTTLAKLLQRAR